MGHTNTKCPMHKSFFEFLSTRFIFVLKLLYSFAEVTEKTKVVKASTLVYFPGAINGTLIQQKIAGSVPYYGVPHVPKRYLLER